MCPPNTIDKNGKCVKCADAGVSKSLSSKKLMTLAVPPNPIACENQCVDSNNDPNNCGGCGAADAKFICTGGQMCQAGTCTCPEGQELVNGQCINKCAGGQVRDSSGQCKCPEGTKLENGQCVPSMYPYGENSLQCPGGTAIGNRNQY